MQISATDKSAPTDILSSSQETTASPAVGAQELNKDLFLQLMVAQLRNQNPLNPVDGVDFLAQLSQISGVEQMVEMRRSLESIENLLQSQMSVPEVQSNQ